MSDRKIIQNIKKKKKKKRLKYILIFEFIIILILLPLGYLFFTIDSIPTYEMNKSDIAINNLVGDNIDQYKNIAIFGVDSRSNELEKNTRSDSIMVASINKKNKDVSLISFYRDTYVSIKDHGYTKINHAYSYGGPELAISTLNANFDLNITDFITINFSALTNIIDMLDGITINITETELEYVNAYTRDVAKINGTDYEYLTSAGEQLINGTQATAYCRVRNTKGGDFTRAQRQRTVIEQILKKSKSSSLPTLVSLSKEMLPQVYTSLSTSEILGLATGVFSYDIVENSGFPFESKNAQISGASVVLPQTLVSNVSTLHDLLFKTTNYKPSDTVQAHSTEIEQK
jgi:polyisoprenyl-teichoic acid--peptidoglycan teichoic acid transferase